MLFSILDILPGTEIKTRAENSFIIGKGSCDSNSLYYNFRNEDTALLYSYIYAYSKYIQPEIDMTRRGMSLLSNKNFFQEINNKMQLTKIYLSINLMGFDFFKSLLREGAAQYYNIYSHYKKKSDEAKNFLQKMTDRPDFDYEYDFEC